VAGLFTPIFVPDGLAGAVSDRAWLQAMLDAEAALAVAEARAGVIPAAAASAIADACHAERFDIDALGAAARDSGNPVVPLVRALTESLPDDAARYVHWGATSQDVLDTAAMLVARHALDLILAEIDAGAAACAALAHAFRSTPMAARTLLQQALPTTFGLKAAGWLVAVAEARSGLAAVRLNGLAVQLGGAAGTLAALEGRGIEVLGNFAAELDLAEPPLPWHADRTRVAALAAGLALAAGSLAKVALDVELLSQTEVGEVAEPSGGGRGGSSAMPHKRNPVGSVRARACARRVQANTASIIAGMEQEHERAAGAWHAEWQPLAEALALTGGAASALREALEGLQVDPERMRENLAIGGDALLAEHAVMVLAERVGRPEARRIVDEALAGGSLREALAPHMDADTIERALDPAAYVGAAGELIDRALARYGA
jgi:3-carboxy-cis,cis-muconate cycloisomerase